MGLSLRLGGPLGLRGGDGVRSIELPPEEGEEAGRSAVGRRNPKCAGVGSRRHATISSTINYTY